MGFRLPAFPTGEGITDEGFVLAHIRNFGAGEPGWPGTARTMIPGVDPSASLYDSPDPYGASTPDQLDHRVRDGVATRRELLPAQEYTRTRQTRVSAFQSSVPAATFFQGLFGQVRWSGVFEGMGVAPRPVILRGPLPINWNPNQSGSKELHPATQYEPVPPMGSLVDFYGSSQKAL